MHRRGRASAPGPTRARARDRVGAAPGDAAPIWREEATGPRGAQQLVGAPRPDAPGFLEEAPAGPEVPDLEPIRPDLGEVRTVIGDGQVRTEPTGVLPEHLSLLEIVDDSRAQVRADEGTA